jgi:hypothetical protein
MVSKSTNVRLNEILFAQIAATDVYGKKQFNIFT